MIEQLRTCWSRSLPQAGRLFGRGLFLMLDSTKPTKVKVAGTFHVPSA